MYVCLCVLCVYVLWLCYGRSIPQVLRRVGRAICGGQVGERVAPVAVPLAHVCVEFALVFVERAALGAAEVVVGGVVAAAKRSGGGRQLAGARVVVQKVLFALVALVKELIGWGFFCKKKSLDANANHKTQEACVQDCRQP